MLGREYVKSRYARFRSDATYTLRANGTGGDCGGIGTWTDSTRTCRLSGNPSPGATILVRDDGITLDGAGRLMTGQGTGSAVSIIGNSHIVIQNIRIERYASAVFLQRASRNTLTNLDIRSTTANSIHLMGNSEFNAIINNDVGPSTMHGIALWSSNGNFIANNRVHAIRDGIRLQSSDGNVIVLNEVQDAEIEGLDLHLSKNNRVVLNSLLGTTPIPVLDDVGANLYQLGSGGNYYVRHDSSTAGCADAQGDGFCDQPYKFAIGVDHRPLARPRDGISGSR
jgi:parallel beta-helix repeat protein